MKQIPLAIGIDTPRSFDSFVPGANTAAVKHLAGLAPGAAPVYLWGAPGSGKTHLLEALVARMTAHAGHAGWFTPSTPVPWAHDDARALVVFDDVDRYDPGRQHEAFALFVQAATASIPIAAAGRVPPVDLPLRDDLRTRFGWGHVLTIEPLSEADSRAALRREADRRGLFLSDDVMAYLLTRFARDMKHLVALLDRLDRYALQRQRHLTVPLLKQMLSEGTPGEVAP